MGNKLRHTINLKSVLGIVSFSGLRITTDPPDLETPPPWGRPDVRLADGPAEFCLSEIQGDEAFANL